MELHHTQYFIPIQIKENCKNNLLTYIIIYLVDCHSFIEITSRTMYNQYACVIAHQNLLESVHLYIHHSVVISVTEKHSFN